MTNLHLTDIPALDYQGSSIFLLFAWIAFLLALFSLPLAVFLVATSTKIPAGKFPLLPVLSCLLSLGLFVSIFVLAHHNNVLADNRDKAYEKSSAVIAEKNISAVEDWVNSTYVVTVDDENAKDLLLLERDYTKHDYMSKYDNFVGLVYSSYEKSRVSPLGNTYVKSASGEVLQVQLAWDGDKYVLLRVSGGEVERR